VTNEELIQELSFPVYRRLATMIFVPAASHGSAVEMVAVDPRDLQKAQDRDAKDPVNRNARLDRNELGPAHYRQVPSCISNRGSPHGSSSKVQYSVEIVNWKIPSVHFNNLIREETLNLVRQRLNTPDATGR
jgi:hypothetical protein